MENPTLKELIEKLKMRPPAVQKIFLSKSPQTYKVFIHSLKIEPYLKDFYLLADIAFLKKITEPARKISIVSRPWGSFIEAASFTDDETALSTNYDAVWIRDSLWGFLSLNSQKETKAQAKEILLTLMDYIESQKARMIFAIKDPSIVRSRDGKMNAVHIRFDAKSPDFSDVKEQGEVQIWNHKQNDALGLLIDCVLNALKEKLISKGDLEKNDRLGALLYLIAYLETIKFYDMEDSGAWEEEEKLNSSSIALVLSAFENLHNFLNSDADFAKLYNEKISLLDLENIAPPKIKISISKGYKILQEQISQGGESPLYKKSDSRYRESDAALLNLIYPAKLSLLSFETKEKILNLVETLSGQYGIKRYEGDNYQSANFWFNEIKTDTDAKSIEKREKFFIADSEAQWFFDSWFSLCSLILYQESKEKKFLDKSIKYANRALGQITGDNMTGADGKNVPPFNLPESYNALIFNGEKFIAPSPIIPLNWAKSSLTLMFEHFKILEQCELSTH